jgi:hypothetical protein
MSEIIGTLAYIRKLSLPIRLLLAVTRHQSLRLLAANKAASKRKIGSSNTGYISSFDGKAQNYQLVMMRGANCKTFTREFDSHPRLQSPNDLQALKIASRGTCSGNCSVPLRRGRAKVLPTAIRPIRF